MFNIPTDCDHIRIDHAAQRSNGPAPYHTVTLPDDVTISIYENGQIALRSTRNHFHVTGVRNHKGTNVSNMHIMVTPKAALPEDADEDEGGEDEGPRVFDATRQ